MAGLQSLTHGGPLQRGPSRVRKLAGARLMAVWRLEERADIGVPPLDDVHVDAILARRRGRVA